VSAGDAGATVHAGAPLRDPHRPPRRPRPGAPGVRASTPTFSPTLPLPARCPSRRIFPPAFLPPGLVGETRIASLVLMPATQSVALNSNDSEPGSGLDLRVGATLTPLGGIMTTEGPPLPPTVYQSTLRWFRGWVSPPPPGLGLTDARPSGGVPRGGAARGAAGPRLPPPPPRAHARAPDPYGWNLPVVPPPPPSARRRACCAALGGLSL